MFKKLITLSIALCCTITFAQKLHVPPEIIGKTIRVIVPYGPGGNSDTTARQLAAKMSIQIGVNVIVVNKPGASGSIGASFVAESLPDGLTVCHCETGPSILNKMAGVPGSVSRGDLVPVSASFENSLAIIGPGNAPYNTMKEFMDFMRANSKTASYATTGSLSLLWTEQILAAGGVKGLPPILFKSNAEALNSVMSGVTSFLVAGASDTTKLIEAGKLKVIAIGSVNRLPLWPNVPTIADTYPKMYMVNYMGIFTPKGVPKNVLVFLNAGWSNAVWSSEVVANWHTKGMSPIGGDLNRAQAVYDRFYKEREALYKERGNLLDK